MTSFKQKLIIASSLIFFALVGRLVPHFWNMTPIAGVAILSGARLGWKWGVGVPILAMFLGDLVIGFYSWPILVAVYTSFALTGIVGYFVRKSGKVATVLGGSVFSAILFFLVTNGAVWAFGSIYSHNFLGLIASYVAGLPFLQNQVLGDLFFTSALFAGWELCFYMISKPMIKDLRGEILKI
jgi:uncharacterized membrane protein (Fun14 family)